MFYYVVPFPPCFVRDYALTVTTRAVPPIQTNAAELALDPSLQSLEDPSVPTPVVPCGPMMANFLLAYRRMLETASFSGDSAAAAGASVLSGVRRGLSDLVGRPQHVSPQASRSSSLARTCHAPLLGHKSLQPPAPDRLRL